MNIGSGSNELDPVGTGRQVRIFVEVKNHFREFCMIVDEGIIDFELIISIWCVR